MSSLVGKHIILPTLFAPEAGLYALMAGAASVTFRGDMRFDKRFKSAHRAVIADTRGPLAITVPVEKPLSTAGARWSDVRISPHNSWWMQLVTALESAYGCTPFFEFYIDDLLPVLSQAAVGMSVAEFNACTDTIVRRLLGLRTPVGHTHRGELPPEDAVDLSHGNLADFIPSVGPYWQVRRDKLGFIPRLSVLDLLFSLGPEALPLLEGAISPP